MEKSSFFNSSNGDRKYLAEDFAEYFSSILTSGVFLHEVNALSVTPYNALTISITTGKAYIKGYIYQNTTALQKTLESVTASRIDRIAVRLDMTKRNIIVDVKKGTPATIPTAPALIRTADIWELGIADINLTAGTTVITTGMITDLRADTKYCGGVAMNVDRDAILGDITNTTTSFAEAAIRTNIATTEKTNIVFGKIKKWFTDLKTLAFKDTISNVDVANNAAIELSKISGLGSLAAKSTITDTDISGDISASKIKGNVGSNITAATQSTNDNSTKLATTEFVRNAINFGSSTFLLAGSTATIKRVGKYVYCNHTNLSLRILNNKANGTVFSQVIGTIPVGFRPKTDIVIGVAQKEPDETNWGFASVSNAVISTSGEMSCKLIVVTVGYGSASAATITSINFGYETN